MTTVVAALHPPAGEGDKPCVAGANAARRAMKPAREPDGADLHIRSDFMTSIWCGAMVGCVGAAVIPPLSDGR